MPAVLVDLGAHKLRHRVVLRQIFPGQRLMRLNPITIDCARQASARSPSKRACEPTHGAFHPTVASHASALASSGGAREILPSRCRYAAFGSRQPAAIRGRVGSWPKARAQIFDPGREQPDRVERPRITFHPDGRSSGTTLDRGHAANRRPAVSPSLRFVCPARAESCRPRPRRRTGYDHPACDHGCVGLTVAAARARRKKKKKKKKKKPPPPPPVVRSCRRRSLPPA